MTKPSAFAERFLSRAAGVDVEISEKQLAQLERYYALLARWNARINLTSLPLADYPTETLDRLLIEPLAAARWVKDGPGTWFDLGSGGGSPAIPLKVMRSRLRLAMVESRGRKAAFLREAVRVLGLEETVVFGQRVEELVSDPLAHGKADLVSVRAVRTDDALIRSATTLLRMDGRLLLFGGSDTEPGRLRQLELMSQRDLGPTKAHLFIWAKRP